MFQTSDSGEREEYGSGMVRDTEEGKPNYGLVSPISIPIEQTMEHRRALLMARGAEKYGKHNWEKAEGVEEFFRFISSAERHFKQWKAQILSKAASGAFHDEVRAFIYPDDHPVMIEDHGAATEYNIDGAEFVLSKARLNAATLETMREKIERLARDQAGYAELAEQQRREKEEIEYTEEWSRENGFVEAPDPNLCECCGDEFTGMSFCYECQGSVNPECNQCETERQHGHSGLTCRYSSRTGSCENARI